MRRRPLIAVAAGFVALLSLLAWLLRPDAAGAGDTARLGRGSESVAPQVLPSPREDAEPQPVVAMDAELTATPPPLENSPATAAPTPRKSIDVGVIKPDGEPLEPWLEQELPELEWFVVVATTEPLGERLPESIAPFYRNMGLGRFDRPHSGNVNPDPTVAGFIGTLWLPRPMPVCVSLAVGPMVIAAQRLGEHDETALFVVDPLTVSRLGGSVRLTVVTAETHQPIEGAEVEVGLGSNLSPGGEDGRTDDLGVCELADLTPGPTQLWLSASGFEERGLDVTIPVGATLDLGTLELHAATRVSGRVVFESGEPVERPYVTAFLDAGSLTSSLLCFPFAATRGEDGEFAFEQLGRQRYVLVALAQVDQSYEGARKAMVTVDATSGSVTGLLLTVELAPPVTFVNPAGRQGLSIHVRNEAAPGFDWWPDIPYLESPDEMKVSLLPGRYRIEFAVPGQALRTRFLTLESEPLTVDLGSEEWR